MYINLANIDFNPGQGGGGGVKPSGTLEISENGVFDVYSYASANVNVPTTGFDEREVTEGVYDIVNLNNSASYVHPYALQSNLSLMTVDLPDCAVVYEGAFQACKYLTSVNLPMCSSIGSSGFGICYSLSQINIPMVKTIGQTAFAQCKLLSSLTLCTDVYWTIPFGTRTYGGTPIVNPSSSASIYVRSDTYSLWISSKFWSDYSSKFVSVPVSGPALSFSNGLLSGTTKAIASDFTSYLSVTTSDITGVSLPECRYIGEEAFAYYSTLNQVNLPECRYIYDYAFDNCGSLSQVSLPVCEYIGEVAFQHCSLSQVSLPKCSYIGNGAFLGCINLMSITIGYSSVCNMNVTDIDAFEGTYIELGNGSIYVPASLVEAYKSAPFWSKYSNKIFPIE